MHARDRLAAIAVIDRLAEILRTELGEEAQAIWPVLGPLLQNHLNDRPMTITALADASGLPRTSARRIIFALKAKGWLRFHPVSGTGSRAAVTPCAPLLEQLDSITDQTVKLIVSATDAASLDRFDAASLAPMPGISWPRAAAQGFDDAVELTLIAYEDPVFDILKRNRSDIERFLGNRLQILTYPQSAYRDTLTAALQGAAPANIEAAAPMLVAVPFPWLAELSRNGQLCQLQALQAAGTSSGADFYDAVWQAGWAHDQL